MSEKKFALYDVLLKRTFINSNQNIFNLRKEGFKNIKINLELMDVEYNKTNETDYEGIIGLKIIGKNSETGDQIFEAFSAYSVFAMFQGYTEEEIFEIFNMNLSSYAYPYLRAELKRITNDAGLPPINIPLIDFAKNYLDKYKNKKESD